MEPRRLEPGLTNLNVILVTTPTPQNQTAPQVGIAIDRELNVVTSIPLAASMKDFCPQAILKFNWFGLQSLP